MIITTKGLIALGETEYSIRKQLDDGKLRLIERGYYSTDPDDVFGNEVFISKKYPSAIITGLSAFFIYGLTDFVPEYFYLATEQHSFPIRRNDVKQSYQDPSFFEVGVIDKELEEGVVRTYDLERLLIELFRLKGKYPREIFYDVLSSFRKIKDQIDFYKLNQYLKRFSNGSSLQKKIKEAI